jgi:hypothetical protein
VAGDIGLVEVAEAARHVKAISTHFAVPHFFRWHSAQMISASTS